MAGLGFTDTEVAALGRLASGQAAGEGGEAGTRTRGVRHLGEAGTPGPWELTLEESGGAWTARCAWCYLARGHAGRPVFRGELTAALPGGEVCYLFAVLDTDTDDLTLEAGTDMAPESWPDEDTPAVRHLLYALARPGGTGAWGVARDNRTAPHAMVYG